MTSGTLFLDAASGHDAATDMARAVATVRQLVSTLRRARKLNARIAINCPCPLKDCAVAPDLTLGRVLAGPHYRDEWNFLRDLAQRSPLSCGLEGHGSAVAGLEAVTLGGKRSEALAWAHVVGSATVSLDAHADWQAPWVDGTCTELTDDDEMRSAPVRIRNASHPDHVDVHADWLRSFGYEPLPEADVLWRERSQRFPRLRFLPRVRGDLRVLAGSGMAYRTAVEALNTLNKDALAWASGDPCPAYSIHVTPEFESRRRVCWFPDDATGKQELFDLHARFRGSFAGRLHFRLDGTTRMLVIAYVGFKIPDP